MSQHPITITGHLTHDPHLTKYNEGTVKTRLRVASSRRVPETKDKETVWRDADLVFLDVELWGQFAVNVRRSLVRGMPVIVVGSLVTNQWTDSNGVQQTRTVLKASYVGLDLNRHFIGAQKNSVTYNEAGVEGVGSEGFEGKYTVDSDMTQEPAANSEQEPPAHDDPATLERQRRAADKQQAEGNQRSVAPGVSPAAVAERTKPAKEKVSV